MILMFGFIYILGRERPVGGSGPSTDLVNSSRQVHFSNTLHSTNTPVTSDNTLTPDTVNNVSFVLWKCH